MARLHKVLLVITTTVTLCGLSLTTAWRQLMTNKCSTFDDSSNSNFTQCPTWQQSSSTCKCTCGNTLHGLVKCSKYDNTVRLLAYWNSLPNITSELDKHVCSPLKRTGQLCGECIPDHAPPIYSYDIECVE